VTGAIESVGLSEKLFALAQPLAEQGVAALSLVAVLLSNLVSNVPAVLLFRPYIPEFPNPTQAWLTLAMSTTLAGNLTLLGSVANLIVAEIAYRREVNLSFTEYLKAGPLITAISLTLVFDAGLQWLRRQPRPGFARLTVWGVASLLGLALWIYPSTIPDFPKTNYQHGKAPELYEFLAQQPKDSMVAGVLKETDDLPSFARRSIFVGREYAIPYHVGYANQFRQRVIDLIRAQYSLDRPALAEFIRTTGIDFWLLNRKTFHPDFLDENWIKQYPSVVEEARANLERGNPVLKRSIKRCLVFEDQPGDLLILDAHCVDGRS
jgi:hypothetical protein